MDRGIKPELSCPYLFTFFGSLSIASLILLHSPFLFSQSTNALTAVLVLLQQGFSQGQLRGFKNTLFKGILQP